MDLDALSRVRCALGAVAQHHSDGPRGRRAQLDFFEWHMCVPSGLCQGNPPVGLQKRVRHGARGVHEGSACDECRPVSGAVQGARATCGLRQEDGMV